MVIHTGLKSHQCPLCPFRCARKDNLKSHMKVREVFTNFQNTWSVNQKMIAQQTYFSGICKKISLFVPLIMCLFK